MFLQDERLSSRANTSVFKNCDFNLKDIKLRKTHNSNKHKHHAQQIDVRKTITVNARSSWTEGYHSEASLYGVSQQQAPRRVYLLILVLYVFGNLL